MFDQAQLHSDVEPVEDMRCRLWQGFSQAFQVFCTVRDHGDFAFALMAKTKRGLVRLRPHSWS